MFTYKLDKATKLGDYDQTYGQVYWCESPDEPKPLKFNSQNQDIKAGDTIEAEASENRRTTPKPESTKEPIDYLQLKKVKVVAVGGKLARIQVDEQVTHPGGRPPQMAQSQLDRIEAKLDKLLGDGETFD